MIDSILYHNSLHISNLTPYIFFVLGSRAGVHSVIAFNSKTFVNSFGILFRTQCIILFARCGHTWS